MCERVTIIIGFTSDWLSTDGMRFLNQSKVSNAKSKQFWINFDTQSKTAVS